MAKFREGEKVKRHGSPASVTFEVLSGPHVETAGVYFGINFYLVRNLHTTSYYNRHLTIESERNLFLPGLPE